jgi:hypothetical protein
MTTLSWKKDSPTKFLVECVQLASLFLIYNSFELQ